MAEQAQKEPTMEEILSSIRKIIADDDPSGEIEAAPQIATAPGVTDAFDDDDDTFAELDLSLDEDELTESLPKDEDEILSALSQFDSGSDDVFESVESFDDYADTADNDVFAQDDGFEAAETMFDADTSFDLDSIADDLTETVTAHVEDELTFETVAAEATNEFDDFSDIEEEAPMAVHSHLTDSRTDSAAAGSLGKLFAKPKPVAALAAPTDTTSVEGLVRDALRPMLKEWLDANLPAIVDKHVEAEVQRIARMAR
jgi:cell pole-organizing protein PopZ